MDDLSPYQLQGIRSIDGSITRWAAVDRRSGRRVVVATAPRPHNTKSFLLSDSLSRAAQLYHPHIMEVLDAGLTDESLFHVYPEESCERLGEWILRNRSTSAQEPGRGREHHPLKPRLTMLLSIAETLSYAHDRRIVHGSLGPDHVHVRAGDSPLLSAFSLDSRSGRVDAEHAESAHHPWEADAPSDVRGLCVIVREVLGDILVSGTLTGRFGGPRYESRAQEILSLCGETQQDRTYLSAHALATDLRCCLEGRPLASRPATWAERAFALLTREPLLALGAAFVLGTLLMLAGIAGASIGDRERVEKARVKLRESQYTELIDQGFDRLANGDEEAAHRLFDDSLAVMDGPQAHLGIALIHRATFGSAKTVSMSSTRSLEKHVPLAWEAFQKEARGDSKDISGDLVKDAKSPLDLVALASIFEANEGAFSRVDASYRAAELAAMMSGPTRRLSHTMWIRMARHDPRWAEHAFQRVQQIWPTDANLNDLAFMGLAFGELRTSTARRTLEEPGSRDSARLQAAITLLRDSSAANVELAEREVQRQGYVITGEGGSTRSQLLIFAAIADRTKTYHHAIASAQSYLKHHPDDATAQMVLARLYLLANRFEECLALTEAIMPTHPEARIVRFMHIAARDQRGDLGVAKEAAAVEAEWPTALGTRAILGRRLWADGRHEESLRAYERALAWAPSNKSAHMEMSFGLLGLDRAPEAEAWLQRMPRAEGVDQARAHLFLAWAAARRGDKGQALEEIKKAESGVSDNPDLIRLRALVVAQQLKLPQDALKDLDHAHAHHQNDDLIRFFLGEGLHTVGERARAVEVLAPIVDRESPHLEATLRTVHALVSLRENDRAWLVLERGLQAFPDESSWHLPRATLLERQGRHAEAIDAYKLYLRAKPDHAEAWCNLGLAYETLGDLKSAVPCLER